MGGGLLPKNDPTYADTIDTQLITHRLTTGRLSGWLLGGPYPNLHANSAQKGGYLGRRTS